MTAFVARLREFHEACGAPTYRSLVGVSRRLGDLYPDQVNAERDLPGLSVTAVSEVLGGRRANLPTAGWVVAFVLSCQRRAYETMVIPSDPGTDIVPAWIRELQAARAAAARSSLAPTASGGDCGADERRGPSEVPAGGAPRQGSTDVQPPAGRVGTTGEGTEPSTGQRAAGTGETAKAWSPPCGRDCPAAPAARPDERKARGPRTAVMQCQGALGRGVWIASRRTGLGACPAHSR